MHRLFAIISLCLLSCLTAFAFVPAGSEAQYYVQSALENQSSPITRARIVALETERVDDSTYQWWELTMEKRDGGVLGVRILSSEVPMTSKTAPGKIIRYIYAPANGPCLEYRNERTGQALLPEIDFEQAFVPQPGKNTRYVDGFATTGSLLGHVLIRSRLRDDFPPVSFSSPKVLNLRPDLMIGAQVDYRHDYDPTKEPDNQQSRPYSKEDYEEMIRAGANYFSPTPEMREWLQNEAVFWRGKGVFPDDFYRSNYYTGHMFLDEPVIRFGWNEGIPRPSSPEMMAEAITTRFKAMERPSERRLNTVNHPEMGALDLCVPPIAVWETHYWSAWYQFAGGAPGTVHEGRYRKRGYGYVPEMWFGEGLENLTDKDMFNYYYAFLRGGARAFNGWWGTSIYSESDPKYRLPAIIEAYNKGARMIWFWTWADVDFKEQVRLIKGLMDYARRHPRPSPDECLRAAKVGIALPPGYAFNEDAIWGMERDQLNEKGVRYGDIADAAIWEGMLCSRRGLEYDFLVDSPGIEKLGYDQLVIIRSNGSVEWLPERKEVRAPKNLKLTVEPKQGKLPAGDMSTPTDHQIPRADKISVDADFSDWSNARWIEMDGEPFIFGDTFKTTLTIKVPETITGDRDPWTYCEYLGFGFADPSVENWTKYRLDLGPQDTGIVITEVRPGSAAEQAGLLVGDVVYEMNGQRTRWQFEAHRVLQGFRKQPGTTIEAKIRRNGFGFLGGSKDLSARMAFALDDDYFYVAAEVTDDVHRQNKNGWELWMHDSLQIGIDPILERTPDWYTDNCHEIGLALRGDQPIIWRWKGRRGQIVGDMAAHIATSSNVAIKRVDGRTLYEAAIPTSEFHPFSPDMWPKCGINVVVNDCDGGELRKSRLELRPKASTAGKHPKDFAVMECAPSPNKNKLSAAIFWEQRCLQPGGKAVLTVVVGSLGMTQAKIQAELKSLDDPKTRPIRAETTIAVSPEPMQYTLFASTDSPPGRYSLTITVLGTDGRVAARDELPVFVYP